MALSKQQKAAMRSNERLHGKTAGLPGNENVPGDEYVTEFEREFLTDRLETLRTD